MDRDEWPRIRREVRFWGDIAMTLSLLGVASVFMGPETKPVNLMAALVLFCAGLAAWAKRKGLHPAWGLMGMSCLLGVLVIRFLPKCCRSCERACPGASDDCPGCGAPI